MMFTTEHRQMLISTTMLGEMCEVGTWLHLQLYIDVPRTQRQALLPDSSAPTMPQMQ